MNKRQKVVVVFWLAAVAVLGVLWVPWLIVEPTIGGPQSVGNTGRYPIFNPPYGWALNGQTVHSNTERIVLEIGVATLLAGGLLLLFKGSIDA